MNDAEYKYYVAKVTDVQGKVHHDWTVATGLHDAGRRFDEEYGGVVYSIDGPFDTENEAKGFIERMK